MIGHGAGGAGGGNPNGNDTAALSDAQRGQIGDKVRECWTKDAGALVLRGDVYKPRTSPYSFQGLGEEGLAILEACRRDTGLPIIVEVVDVHHVERVAAVADCLRVGTRNAQNFELLKEVGQARKPVMLKRGLAMTVDEWLQAADATPDMQHWGGGDEPAPKAELLNFMERFEAELDDCGFLRNLEQRPMMVRNLRNLFQRARPTSQELRTMHGAVRNLVDKRKS